MQLGKAMFASSTVYHEIENEAVDNDVLVHTYPPRKPATIKREMALDGCAIKCLLFAFNDK